MASLETTTVQLQGASGAAIQTALIGSDKLIVTGGSFTQVMTTPHVNSSLGSFPGLDLLRSVISVDAMHDARARFPPPKCWPDTYINVKDSVLKWTTTPKQPAIICFTGKPESGKSAIAHEMAEALSRRGVLAASFFFDKDRSQGDGDFFLTLAYQIAVSVPGMAKLVNTAIVRDPTNLQKRGETQLTTLIFEPLFCIPTPETPFVVVINGLDRCRDSFAQLEIIRLLCQMSLFFGDTIRFLIFASQGGLDSALSNNIFHWVGRHIPLHGESMSTPLPPFDKYLIEPWQTELASINDMWCHSDLDDGSDRKHVVNNSDATTGNLRRWHHRVVSQTFQSRALVRTSPKHVGMSETIAFTTNVMGSPMSIDLSRGSPRGLGGSPMIIDSLKTSPVQGGSPMVIDGAYISSSLAISVAHSACFGHPTSPAQAQQDKQEAGIISDALGLAWD